MGSRGEEARRYARILVQAREILSTVRNPVARMGTIAALLHHKTPGLSWTGFYLLDGESLVVGPYQGLVACVVLRKPRGVCWAGVLRNEPVIVPDVRAFPGHVACDPRSRSEIVVPLRRPDGAVLGVLDVDSTLPARFDEGDASGLAPLADLVFAGE